MRYRVCALPALQVRPSLVRAQVLGFVKSHLAEINADELIAVIEQLIDQNYATVRCCAVLCCAALLWVLRCIGGRPLVQCSLLRAGGR